MPEKVVMEPWGAIHQKITLDTLGTIPHLLLFLTSGSEAALSLGDQRALSPPRGGSSAALEGLATTPGRLHPQGHRDGAGRNGTASFRDHKAERTTERREVVRTLKTKFLLFQAGQERDSVLSR